MKILLTTGIFPPDEGGPASYVPRIAAHLKQKGHEVDVVCWSDDLNHQDNATYPFRVHRIERKTPKPRRFLQTIKKIKQLSLGKDIIYINGLQFESSLACRSTGLPSVHKVVGDYAWEKARNRKLYRGTIDEYQNASKGPRLKFLDWHRNYPLKSASKVITPSHYLKRIVTGWGIDTNLIQVIYNAVPAPCTGATVALPPFNGPTVATVCRLVSWKGVEGIIAAVAMLPHVRLVVAGDGPLLEHLRSSAHKALGAARAIFLGHVPHDSVASVLRQSTAFVLNSTYEGLPHVVLEAMSTCTAVIATDAGGTGEVVINESTGTLVRIGDTRSLADAIERITKDSQFRHRIICGATEMLSRSFSYQRMLESAEAALVANSKRCEGHAR